MARIEDKKKEEGQEMKENENMKEKQKGKRGKVKEMRGEIGFRERKNGN